MRDKAWGTGIGAGLVMLAVIVAFVLMVVVPVAQNRRKDARSDAAQESLARIWQAERAHRQFKGEWALFEARDDEGWKSLALDLEESRFAFAARPLGTALVIVGRANLDSDNRIDDWELASTDPVPFHVFDDTWNVYGSEVYYTELKLPDKAKNPDLSAADRARARAFHAQVLASRAQTTTTAQ